VVVGRAGGTVKLRGLDSYHTFVATIIEEWKYVVK